jgi:branched-chain amino acid transport system substrate-binding protein
MGAHRLLRIGLAAMAVSAVVAVSGCASSGSGIQAGERADVYVSMPLHGPEAANGRDVVDGARLALADADGRVGELAVRATYLDDTSGTGSNAGWSGARAAANARQATQDSAAIAYIGDFDSGATRFSLPITNEAHLLQISPAASAIDLVQPYLGAGDQVPEEIQPTGERTFGRVIPSDEAQAQAGAEWAKRLRARLVRVAGDGSGFADVMRSGFAAEARQLGLRVRSTKGLLAPRAPQRTFVCPLQARFPVALDYYAGAAPLQLGSGSPCEHPGLMTSDALLEPQTLRAMESAAFLATSAAEDPSQLPGSGQGFVRAFSSRYHREPGRYAAYGYEAMGVVLDSIRRAGDSGDQRDAVVDAFFDTTDRRSILGTYSVDEVGNTTLGRLAGYRVVKGRPRFETALSAGE